MPRRLSRLRRPAQLDRGVSVGSAGTVDDDRLPDAHQPQNPEPQSHDPRNTESAEFSVHLDNFEGPFDLLLQLISRHQLDITEVALSQVTDEFIGHIKAAGAGWDLEQTSSFIVVAATLLDLKAARLIPSGEVDDPEDLALLEARDLLFVRLLQYRAYKQVAAFLASTLEAESRRYPREVGLEPYFARLLPEVELTITLDQFAALAAKALTPRLAPVLSLDHLHAPQVSVREQAGLLVERLRRAQTLTFRSLTGDSPDVHTTVARFLALLELFREGAVAFEQITPLGELTVRWTGADHGDLDISDEFDGTASPETPVLEKPGPGRLAPEKPTQDKAAPDEPGPSLMSDL